MSLKAAITLLDAEIEQLSRTAGPTQFALVRAKSFGRSLLRRAEQLGVGGNPEALNLYYKSQLRRLKLEEQEEEESGG
jgi:hypothetical protein